MLSIAHVHDSATLHRRGTNDEVTLCGVARLLPRCLRAKATALTRPFLFVRRDCGWRDVGIHVPVPDASADAVDNTDSNADGGTDRDSDASLERSAVNAITRAVDAAVVRVACVSASAFAVLAAVVTGCMSLARSRPRWTQVGTAPSEAARLTVQIMELLQYLRLTRPLRARDVNAALEGGGGGGDGDDTVLLLRYADETGLSAAAADMVCPISQQVGLMFMEWCPADHRPHNESAVALTIGAVAVATPCNALPLRVSSTTLRVWCWNVLWTSGVRLCRRVSKMGCRCV